MPQPIFPQVSNSTDWICDFQVQNGDTGLPLADLNDLEMLVEIRKRDAAPTLTASFENGKITDRGFGVVQWHFTGQEMSSLNPDTYDVGITLTHDGVTNQELIALLPVIDGVARS